MLTMAISPECLYRAFSEFPLTCNKKDGTEQSEEGRKGGGELEEMDVTRNQYSGISHSFVNHLGEGVCSLCELGPASVKADLKNSSYQAACRLREEERREKEGKRKRETKRESRRGRDE